MKEIDGNCPTAALQPVRVEAVGSHDLISLRDAWSRVLGLATWADMIRTHMDHQAKLRKIGRVAGGLP